MRAEPPVAYAAMSSPKLFLQVSEAPQSISQHLKAEDESRRAGDGERDAAIGRKASFGAGEARADPNERSLRLYPLVLTHFFHGIECLQIKKQEESRRDFPASDDAPNDDQRRAAPSTLQVPVPCLQRGADLKI